VILVCATLMIGSSFAGQDFALAIDSSEERRGHGWIVPRARRIVHAG